MVIIQIVLKSRLFGTILFSSNFSISSTTYPTVWFQKVADGRLELLPVRINVRQNANQFITPQGAQKKN
jgi:hypothetical protein